MAKLKVHHLNQTVVLLVVCAVSAMLGFVLRPSRGVMAKAYPLASLRQSDEKIIDRKEFPNEPLEFDNLSVKKVRIAPHQTFSAKSLAESSGGKVEDWLENLKFTIKNTSDKRIIYIDVELDFPETTVNGPMMVYNQLGIGIHPKAFGDRLKYNTPLALDPGDTTTFTFSAQRLQLLKEFLAFRSFQLADLSQAIIRVSYVIFDNGAKWSQGDYYKLNPSAPGGYEKVNPNIQ